MRATNKIKKGNVLENHIHDHWIHAKNNVKKKKGQTEFKIQKMTELFTVSDEVRVENLHPPPQKKRKSHETKLSEYRKFSFRLRQGSTRKLAHCQLIRRKSRFTIEFPTHSSKYEGTGHVFILFWCPSMIFNRNNLKI